MPSQKDKLLTGEEREYFNVKLLTYAARHRREHGTEVYLSTIKVNKQLRLEMPDFYMFVKMHDMHKVCFAVIVTNNSNAHVLGVINPKSFYVIELLKEIAVCFLMAIYNKRHLAKTEALALTDSLTGAANRMAYKNDIKTIDIRNSKLFACIYIDVNELHYFNDKYGHAAGDQMLVFIADVLRKEFSDSYVYRMGGDEFLIFTENLSSDVIESRIHNANVQIEEMKYHISIGIKYGDGYSDIEELVSEAEKLMYIEKARYYQNKELNKVTNLTNRTMESVETGINEIDACLAVMSVRYLGIFCVSHNNDYSRQILVPSYFSEILEHESRFSAAMRKYIHDIVKPEFHRTLLNFLEYDVLERELKNGGG